MRRRDGAQRGGTLSMATTLGFGHGVQHAALHASRDGVIPERFLPQANLSDDAAACAASALSHASRRN